MSSLINNDEGIEMDGEHLKKIKSHIIGLINRIDIEVISSNKHSCLLSIIDFYYRYQFKNTICTLETQPAGMIHTDLSFNISQDAETHLFNILFDEFLPIIYHAIELYGIDSVSMSFNGGKDCTVLLHGLYSVMELFFYENNKYDDIYSHHIKTLYVSCPDGFQDLDRFVKLCSSKYNLELFTSFQPLKNGLTEFMENFNDLSCIIIGTRRTDPFGDKLKPYLETDGDWYKTMRIHPILNFDYIDIWHYLKFMKMDYCNLYDEGYTSLGHPSCTLHNPYLIKDNENKDYYPAYYLKNGNENERKGRIVKY